MLISDRLPGGASPEGLGQRPEVTGRVPAFSPPPSEGGYWAAVMKPTAFRLLPLAAGPARPVAPAPGLGEDQPGNLCPGAS